MNTIQELSALTATAPHPSVSNKYKFVSSAQIIEDLKSQGWMLSKVSKVRSRSGLGKHLMRFRSEDPAFTLPSGDFLEIIVFTSHDGTCSVSISLGIFRLVCANGLMVGQNLVSPVRIRHVGYAVEKVKTALTSLLSHANLIKSTVEKLKNRQLTVEEYTQFISLALEARGLKPQSTVADQLHRPRRVEDQGVNAWAVLNRIQEYALNGFRYTDLAENEVKTARKITGAAAQIKLNQALFDGMVKIAA